MSLVEPVIIPDNDSARSVFSPDADRHVANVRLTQTEDDHRTLSMVMGLLQSSRDFRKPMIPRWRSNYRMLFNRYWNGQHASWMPNPQIPEIFPIVRAMAGFMTDRRITNTVTPYAIPMQPWHDFLITLAQDLEVTLDANWQANHQEREWIIAVIDSLLYGSGIVKTCWETQLAGGLGDAMTRRVHPFSFYPDPRATSTDDMDFCIEIRRMSVQELDRRFPGTADLFGSGGMIQDIDQAPSLFDYGLGRPSVPYSNPGAISPNTMPANNFRVGSGRLATTDLPGVDVIECWYKDHVFASVTDDRTGEKAQFPKERWRVAVIANQHVLMHELASDLWDHAGHPYDRIPFFDMGEFWGPSMVELLTSSQHSLNRILAAAQQNIELSGNPIWKDTVRSNSSRKPLSNRPGTRMTVPDGASANAVGWEKPPELNQATPWLTNFHLQRMEAISGVTAINRGSTPSGRNAQGTIEAVQESGFVVIRLALKFLEYALRSAGEKRASLIIENYTTPRLIALAGRESEGTFRVLKARHFSVATPDGAVPFKFMLNVDAGSRSETSRQLTADRAMQLMTIGAITPQDGLRAMDFPDADGAAKRQQQAMQEQAAQQASMKDRTRALSG